MIHLVTTLELLPVAQSDGVGFREWARNRIRWYYGDMPSVVDVKVFATDIGDAYTIELWVTFLDEDGYAEFRRRQRAGHQDSAREARRSEQEQWWRFVRSRLMRDLDVGFDAEVRS